MILSTDLFILRKPSGMLSTCMQVLFADTELFFIEDGVGYLKERTDIDNLRYKTKEMRKTGIFIQFSAVRYALEPTKRHHRMSVSRKVL